MAQLLHWLADLCAGKGTAEQARLRFHRAQINKAKKNEARLQAWISRQLQVNFAWEPILPLPPTQSSLLEGKKLRFVIELSKGFGLILGY
ncbi:MAG: hypothetical protein M1819_000100 [Sarea resinae]|nr:MAG: hypothetical protein M1819_000100 [Sarea resinae]